MLAEILLVHGSETVYVFDLVTTFRYGDILVRLVPRDWRAS